MEWCILLKMVVFSKMTRVAKVLVILLVVVSQEVKSDGGAFLV